MYLFATWEGMQDLSSLVGDGTHAPLRWKHSLNHWTAREVPVTTFLV